MTTPNARELELARSVQLGAGNWTEALAQLLANYREELRAGRSPVESRGGVALTMPKWEHTGNYVFVPLDQPLLSVAYGIAHGLNAARGRVIKQAGIECQMVQTPRPVCVAVVLEAGETLQ